MPNVASRGVHPADRAIRDRDATDPDAAAVLTAFAAYEGSDDAAARTALQTIGLQSPFLDWKLLIRGLMAHATGDNARAIENWKRLDPRRLPAKLAAPVWVGIDPTRVTTTTTRQARKLIDQELVNRLIRLRKLVGRGQSLDPAFQEAAAIVPLLKQQAPELLPRLAAAMYRAIRDHGDRADLPRFHALFGPPADDPEFHKLEAQAYEDCRRPNDAKRHWLQYANWLASNPSGWPPAVRDRARAEVLFRAASLTEASDSQQLLRQACELAPTWDAPASMLFNHLASAGKDVEAESLARRLLTARPDHLPTLDALAELYARVGRLTDLLAVRQHTLVLNPLDASRRKTVADAVARVARTAIIAGDISAAAKLFQTTRAVGDDAGSVSYYVLRAVVAKKLGNASDTCADIARAATDPHVRLAVMYLCAVDASLVKLKPADRKSFNAVFAESLTQPSTPMEALRLVCAFDQLKADQVSYRGQVGHGRSIDAMLLTTGPGTDADYETLGLGLAARKLWKQLGKLTPAWQQRFPKNPVFWLLEVETFVASNAKQPIPFRLTLRLQQARQLAEVSRELRHRALLERIVELQKRVSAYDLLHSLFG